MPESIQKPSQECVCSCQKCVAMCEHSPCWPTPNEAKNLIEAGFGPMLMQDYWAASINIYLIGPAIVGYGGKMAPYWPTGRCVFLSEQGLCELHDLGLKPIEGRRANCKDHEITEGLHEEVAVTWDTDEGHIINKLWEQEVSNNAKT